MTEITVAIPVGPHEADKQWFDECIESVRNQTHPADEILLIDDMAGLELPDRDLTIWRSPWRVGVATAMNFGVALARHPLVFMLCADDTLHPQCLEHCLRAYEKTPEDKKDLTYFFVGVKYLDGREPDEQFIACGAAMVSKELWRRCGGFPPESASGAPDAALLSIMHVHRESGEIVGVGRGHSLYNYRPHADSDSARRHSWQGVILQTRDILTGSWEKPEWGRMP